MITERESKTAQRKILLSLLGKVGGAINTIIDANSNLHKKLTEEKERILLGMYINKTENIEENIGKLKEFITNPEGNILYNKLLRIVQDSQIPEQKPRYQRF
jgi:hypothetical protein